MEYFQNKQGFEWEVVAFTKKEKLADYLQGHHIELLLAGCWEEIEKLPTDLVNYYYQLTEERQEPSPEQNRIYRYQSVERVMEQMLSDYMRRQDEICAKVNPNQMNIITVFSTVPGGQDASFAWSIGFQLARQRKALLLPLEIFSLKQFDFIDQTRQGLSEFIYYLKENSNSIQRWKELLNYCNNLGYLAGTSHGFDVLALNREDIHRWVELLRNSSDYQNVIFYLGFYQEAGMELLRLSDRVIVISGQSHYEQEVYKEWERQMGCIGIDLQQPKFINVIRTSDPGRAEIYHNQQEFMDSPIWQQAVEYLKSK
jgi:hypothetical protein